MPKLIDLTGQRYNRLTAIQPAGKIGGRIAWLFDCSCGKTITTTANSVRTGKTKSCGCLKKEQAAENGKLSAKSILDRIKHGHASKNSKTRDVYNIWCTIRARCLCPTCADYASYGGRGIKICERWSDPANFINDMGPRPSKKHSVDRVDNDGDYEPSNCKWSTPEQQANNRRKRSCNKKR